MYQSGARDYFDAVGYHPYSFPRLTEQHPVLEWLVADGGPESSIRSIVIDNGDSNKQIWGTEVGTPTSGQSGVNETLQALAYRDSIEQMNNKPWLATLFFHTYRDYSSDPNTIESFFGLIRYDGTRKPAYYELQGLLQTR